MTKHIFRVRRALGMALVAGLIGCPGVQSFAGESSPEPRWWKGNLHTHSHWSDGDDFPEMIADWYKREGYHFLAFTEHNTLAAGRRWVSIEKSRGGEVAFDKYLKRWGADWVETRVHEGQRQVVLKPWTEFRALFDEPQRFLLIQAEEVTDRHLAAPVHINVSNVRELIEPQGGASVLEVMQNNVRAILEQRERTGQPMLPHVNHPNFGWGVTAEELMQVEGEQFFEVYNGHPAVHNEGDAVHAGTDAMWDIILTWRLAKLKMPIMYGIATDDSHSYHEQASNLSNSGRGWVFVKASRLTPESIVLAMEAGEFYASSGVVLRDVQFTDNRLSIQIQSEDGVQYQTQFIGTRHGFDDSNHRIRNAAGEALRVTHRYSEDIGRVFATVEGLNPGYQLHGDELYVRALVTSSKLKKNPYLKGELERAWVQPVLPEP